MDILIAAVVLTGLGALALLMLTLAGIRAEERHMSLTGAPRTRIEASNPPAARSRRPHPRHLPRQRPDSSRERSAMTVSIPPVTFPGSRNRPGDDWPPPDLAAWS